MNKDYLEYNARVNLKDADGNLQLEEDQKALHDYFVNHVNPNTVFFHNLEEKIEYMCSQGYWDEEVFEGLDRTEVKDLFRHAYSFKFRFKSFVGAYKFYNSYACKTYDGTRFLERYEDRVCMVALSLTTNINDAVMLVDEIISGRFQPATPTFLNAGRGDAGELVSCFLLRVEDNMESIGRAITHSLQLSKRGGGVALNLTNVRENGAPIKQVEGQSSGVLPVMKLLEDSFSYANQLGARQGAGAVYLHACHPDIYRFLDTKRENADEKVRIKTLSLGVVVPDILMEKAKAGEDIYQFSPYSIMEEYGREMSDISITEWYDVLVENPNITKTKTSARKLLQTFAEVQFESGYPYIVFEDNVNRANHGNGWINMSNLCTEILQENEDSLYSDDLSYQHIGKDISCNLGSMNVAEVMRHGGTAFPTSVGVAVQFLTSVSENSDISCVPSIQRGNDATHAIGLGQMNLHGYLAEAGIEYGSEECLDFVNVYFSLVKYHALIESALKAYAENKKYLGFEDSEYASGIALADYFEEGYTMPKTDKVKEIFKDWTLPNAENWKWLSDQIQQYGLYNKYLLAVPPTGNISYINHATPSIHPVASPVEIRKEGKMGRVYYPSPGLTNDNLELFKDAYEIGYEKLIDVYAVATKHTDQGLSLTLFFPDTATTRDLNKAQIYAWRKGIKTLYYARIRQDALEGTAVDSCVSCTL